MEININNYEAYFIDYLEGNLDEGLVDDFIEFLQQNPDLKEELSLFETVSVEPENIIFNKKENLYKEKYDSEKEFNTAAIANLENDISEEEKINFDNYILTHPEKKKDIALFEKTKLNADETIFFRKKKKLYHYSSGRTILFWSGRIAAILVLALAFYVLIDKSSNKIIPEKQLASVEETTNKKEVIPETEIVPTETEKKVPEKAKKETPKPEIKKAVPEKKPNKSLRETTKGRMEHEDIALIREPIEVPAIMNSLGASLNIQYASASLATMEIQNPEIQNEIYEERLLADIVKEKTGLDKFKFNTITKAGLNLVSNFTKNNFTYETNKEGKVTEYNYESRLVAFSIPSKNEIAGD